MNILEKLEIEEKIIKIIDDMDDIDALDLHNKYCLKTNKTNRIIYTMDDFDSVMKDKSPSYIALKIYNSDFVPTDDYFTVGCHGMLNSCIDVFKFINIGAIASYMVNNKDSLDNYEIYCLLEKYYGNNSEIE